MPAIAVNNEAGTFTHRCARCGHTAELRLDPLYGDLTVYPRCLMVRPCPQCAQEIDPDSGQHLRVEEGLRRDIPAWEAGEVSATDGTPAKHPQSLVGTEYDLGGGKRSVVIEHHIGYSMSDEHRLFRRTIRAMQRHPLLAPHAPLKNG